jgi:ribosomal protein S18 acetylase RimI-like enzyme
MSGGQHIVDSDRPWRPMSADDLAAVHALSMRVHPNYPERAEVLAEKFRLFPAGCFVLETSGGVAGYCFSHPWSKGTVPALDSLLGALPVTPTTYYVHDLTLDEALRGQGQGRAIVPLLFQAAESLGLAHLSLVAVNRRGPFWQAAGFARTADESLQATARAKYDSDAVHMERTL